MTRARAPSARAPKRAKARRPPAPAPRADFEEIDIRTEDGVSLRAVVDDPPEGAPLAGTCVLAHAMFARKSEFARPEGAGLAQALGARGFRTVAFDFRGHGDSALRPPAEWGYDDLVRFDLPAVVEAARARGEGKPVFVVGHSLGAHVALAAQGTSRMAADGVVAIAGNVWLRRLEPSRVRWVAKLATTGALLAAVARAGRFPARRLRLGSDDEAATYMRDLFEGVLRGRWGSADGRDDYLASLARVDVPVCAVASDGDRLMCAPASASAFARLCGGPVEVVRVARSDDGGPPPGHMELVTTLRARSALLRAVDWVASRARP